MRCLLPALGLGLGLGLGLSSLSSAAQPRLTVHAGDHDRQDCPVSFDWPHGGGAWVLRTPEGRLLPIQRSGNLAWYVEPGLPRGTTRQYPLLPVPPSDAEAPAQGARATHRNQNLTLSLGDRPVLTYLAGPGELPREAIPEAFRRGGYLHPVHTPSGRIVTDDYPPNHIHHHGFWWSWPRTVFEERRPDFWNMGEQRGRTDFEALDAFEHGPVFASLHARQVFTDVLVDPPRIALRETWEIRLFALSPRAGVHLFDLNSSQSVPDASAVLFPRYYYGGFAFRGPWAWNGPAAARYLDANGVTNRVAANETRARWFWLGGTVEDALSGVAVLGHPTNFRAPQPLRVHPREPFVCWTPSQLGDWSIQPDSPLHSRYRIVTLDGEPDPARIEALWHDFATPPLAVLEGSLVPADP
ncbi:MAG: PmoA family protein [Verrucomicrobiae bacterium]|nr:PmoA family protein [Verrucomicrobiae bacterium]